MCEIFGRNSSCAIVTGSPALKQYKYGKLIDQHDIVMRLNRRCMEPTDSYGSKRTHMMVNNGFWLEDDRLYQKISLLKDKKEFVILNIFSWRWLTKDILSLLEFFKTRNQSLNKTLVLDPEFISDVFRTFNAFTNGNSYWPSSGFFSLVILSRVCSSVHGFGFIDPAEDDGHAYWAEHQLFRKWSLDQEAEMKLYLYLPYRTGTGTGVPVG